MSFLIRIEFEKIWKRKSYLILSLVLLTLNLFFLWYFQQENNTTTPASAYQKLDTELSALPNKERQPYVKDLLLRKEAFLWIQSLRNQNMEESKALEDQSQQKTYNKYIQDYLKQHNPSYTISLEQDCLFLQEVVKDIQYIQEYDSYLNHIEEVAQELTSVSVFHEDKHSLTSRNIRKTADDYRTMRNVRPQITISRGFDMATQSGLCDAITIIFIFLLSGALIFEEKEKNLFSLIRGTPRGRTKTIVAKIVVCLCSAGIFLFLLYSSQYLFQLSTTSFPNFHLPLQSIPSFRNSIWRISIGQYLLLFLFSKWIVFSLVSMLLLTITIFAKKIYTAFAGCALIFLGSYFLYTLIPAASIIRIWKCLNLIGVLNTNALFQIYDNIQIRQSILPIQYMLWSIIVLCIIVLLTINIISFSNCKKLDSKTPLFLHKWSLHPFRSKLCNISLMGHEAYKVLIINKGLLIIILFITSYACFQFKQTIQTQGNIVYQQYMDILEGPLTKAKEKFIAKEMQTFANMNQQLDRIEERYQKKGISMLQRNMAQMPFQMLIEKANIFQGIQPQYQYVGKHPNTYFLDQRGYLKILDTQVAELPIFILMISLMLLLFSNTFAMEYKHNFICISSACALGRKKTVRMKLWLSLMIAFVCFILLYGFYLLPILSEYHFHYWNAPVTSLLAWQTLQLPISVGMLFILTLCMKFIAIITITLFLLYLSKKCKTLQLTLIIGSLCLLIPLILHVMGFDIFRYVSLAPVFFCGSYYKERSTFLISLLYTAICLSGSLFIYRRLLSTYANFH